MSRHARPARRLVGVAAALCTTLLALVGLAATANAAKPSPIPTATASATVNGDSATITVIVNTTPNKIPGATCSIDGGQPVSCGTPTAYGNATKYTVTLDGLAGGRHEFLYSIWVQTPKGLTLAPIATTQFETEGPPLLPQDVCAAESGTFKDGFTSWHCTWPQGTRPSGTELGYLCHEQGGLFSVASTNDTDGYYCAKPIVVQARNACLPLPDARFGNWDSLHISWWDCQTSDLAASPNAFQDICRTMGGLWSSSLINNGQTLTFTCSTPPPF